MEMLRFVEAEKCRFASTFPSDFMCDECRFDLFSCRYPPIWISDFKLYKFRVGFQPRFDLNLYIFDYILARNPELYLVRLIQSLKTLYLDCNKIFAL